MRIIFIIVLFPWEGTKAFQPPGLQNHRNPPSINRVVPQVSRKVRSSTTGRKSVQLVKHHCLKESRPNPGKLIQNALSSRFKQVRHWARKAITIAALFFIVNFAVVNVAFARSGGRMGGSFGPRPLSPPITRTLPRSSSYRSQPRVIIHRTSPFHMHLPSTGDTVRESAVITGSYAGPVRRLTLSDGAVVTGVAAIVALNVLDKVSKDDRGGTQEGPLGPGVSVVSLTVAMNVPDRDSPDSVLARLSRLALTSRTDSREGVQDLVTETTLELLRQNDSIISADSKYVHFWKAVDAEREFNKLSIGGRSKFDEETSFNYMGKKRHKIPYASVDTNSRATFAVVTINLCIEGDSTKASQVKNHTELMSALSRIASDCQVDNCLLAAEVLWSPESPSERITAQDIYADYPTLYPLI